MLCALGVTAFLLPAALFPPGVTALPFAGVTVFFVAAFFSSSEDDDDESESESESEDELLAAFLFPAALFPPGVTALPFAGVTVFFVAAFFFSSEDDDDESESESKLLEEDDGERARFFDEFEAIDPALDAANPFNAETPLLGAVADSFEEVLVIENFWPQKLTQYGYPNHQRESFGAQTPVVPA
jgi:hypothetical protein